MVVHFKSGISKDGLNYVVGMPRKYFARVRRKFNANVGSILRGKVWVQIGVDKNKNPKYSGPLEFNGMILKRGRWSYYLLPDTDTEKELRKHYGKYHGVVIVEVTGVE